MPKELAPVTRRSPMLPGEAEQQKAASIADAIELAMQRAHDYREEDPDEYGFLQEAEQITGIDILDKDWKARPDDTLWVGRVKARARRAVVSTWYMKGYSIQEIAKKAKVSESTVYRDIQNCELEWRKTYLKNTEVLAGKALATLNMLISKLDAGIERGDTKSILAALEIIKEQGQILGYRQGVMVDIETYVREVSASAGYDPEKAVELAQRISVTMR